MPTATVGEVIDRAKDFERRLETFYADLRDRATHDGVRLLTYYLARHRRHLPEALESFSDTQIERVRKIPVKYEDPGFIPERCFKGKHLPSSVKGERLLEVAIELVETLICSYRRMVEQPLGDEAGNLFKALLKIEESHVVELKKTKAMDYF